jgi:ribonuclease Z
LIPADDVDAMLEPAEEGSGAVSTESIDATELAHEGGAPLTTTPAVGTPAESTDSSFTPSAEPVRDGEVRVTVLGSGHPFVKHGQAPASR